MTKAGDIFTADRKNTKSLIKCRNGIITLYKRAFPSKQIYSTLVK